MFELSEEHQMLKDLVAKFVERDLMPLEKPVLAREMAGQKAALSSEEEAKILATCKELGLWGLDVPESYGGANLPNVALVGVWEEVSRTCVPFTFPPDSPNLHMLIAVANDEQKRKYLDPYARGEAHSAIAISEPGAGGDPAGMTTRAVRDGDDWVINGRKIWVSRVPQSDFTIVMARTGEGKRHEGVTAFIVERGTKGFIIEREIPMLGGQRTYELIFEDCRVPASQLLGQEG
jgi:acyl-CoA dehydrogenase